MAIGYSGWTWEQMVQNVWGEGSDGPDGVSGTRMDRLNVAGPNANWVSFVETWTVKTETGQPPQVAPGQYELIGYRKTGTATEDDSLLENAVSPSTQQDVWQVVRARMSFWDGGPSPASAFDTFYRATANTLDRLFRDENRTFDPLSLHDTGKMLEQAEDYLVETDAALRSILSDIAETAVVQGSAAEVLVEALQRLQIEISTLMREMNATGGDNRISQRVYYSSNDLWDYRNRVNLAWREFSDHTFQAFNTFNPTMLFSAVQTVLDNFGQGTLNAVTIDIPNTYGTGEYGGAYDLSGEAGWTALNAELKRSWNEQVQRLDATMWELLSTLSTKLDHLTTDLNTIHQPSTGSSDGDVNAGSDTGSDSGTGGTDSGVETGIGTGIGGGGSDFGGSSSGGTGLGGDGTVSTLAATGFGGGTAIADGVVGGGSGVGDLGLTGGTAGGITDGGTGGITGGAIGTTTGGTGIGALGGEGGGSVGGLGAASGLGGTGLGIAGLSGPGRGAAGGTSYGKGSSHYHDASGAFGGPADGEGIGGLGGTVGGGRAASVGGMAIGDDLAEMLSGYSALTGGSAVAASGGSSLGGSSPFAGGAPFSPLRGLGRDGEEERRRRTSLEEEDEAWGTDPNCAAAVVGRADAPRRRTEDRPVEEMPTPGRSPQTEQTEERVRVPGIR